MIVKTQMGYGKVRVHVTNSGTQGLQLPLLHLAYGMIFRKLQKKSAIILDSDISWHQNSEDNVYNLKIEM